MPRARNRGPINIFKAAQDQMRKEVTDAEVSVAESPAEIGQQAEQDDAGEIGAAHSEEARNAAGEPEKPQEAASESKAPAKTQTRRFKRKG